MASLVELVEGVRHTNAEAAFTALRKLREAFEDERAPGKCVGTVRQFFALSAKEGNPILEAWERHGAERAASRVVVYALAAAAALFKAARTHAAQETVSQTGLPTKASKAFDDMKRSNLFDARSMAKTILQSRPGAILAVLGARGAERAILGMLGLLREIAQLGGYLAREIMTQIDWSARQLSGLILPQNFKVKQMKLAEKEGKQEGKKSENHESPVRAAFIRLNLALLESGRAEPDVIQSALTGKQFLPAIWKDFGNDPPSLTRPALKVLTEHVLVPSVSAKTKRQFLNTYALTQIAKLYFSDARQQAHEFLMAVFTGPDHGFCGTVVEGTVRGGIGGTGNTSGVLQFLTSLRANEHHQPRELLLNVLTVCPQMQAPYLANYPFMLEPNEALRWLTNVDLFCAVLRLPWWPEQNSNGEQTDVTGQRKDAIVWPAKLSQTVLSKGLQHSNQLVRFHVALMLAGVLERVQRVVGSTANLEEIVDGLKPRLPEVQVLFTMVTVAKVAKAKGTPVAAPKRHDLLLRSLMMRVIHLYALLFPAALSEVKIDLDKLSGAEGSLVELPDSLRQPLLSFMQEAHTHIEWWKREQSKGSSSKFGEVLRFLNVPSMREQASALATTLLESTGLFEGCEWEIGCWLYPLCQPDTQISAAADFLDAVLQQARQKQLALTDEISGAIAMCEGTASSRFSVVIPAVLQRLNSGNAPSAEKWGAKPSEDREYAVAVMATILRCHVAPLSLCALLMQQGSDASEPQSAEERTEVIALANRACRRLSGGSSRTDALRALISASDWAERADSEEGTLWRGARQAAGGYDEAKLKSICEGCADDDFADVLDDISREPEAGAHRCVASFLSQLADRTPAAYKPLACNQVLFQIQMLLSEDGRDWASEAVCKFVQCLYQIAQQLVGLPGADAASSVKQLESCVEASLTLGGLLSQKAETHHAARMMLFETVSLWLTSRRSQQDATSFDLPSLLVTSLREECAGSNDDADHRPCTLLVQMFRTQWDGGMLSRCIATLFTNYRGETDTTDTWVLSSLLRYWSEMEEPFELPSSCFEGLVRLMTANVSDEVDSMATTVLRRALHSSAEQASGSATVSGLWSFLTPEFMELCWNTADESGYRRAILQMLVQRSPLQRRLFMGKLVAHCSSGEDSSSIRDQLWSETVPDREALLRVVSKAPGMAQGSPLVLGMLSCVAAAVTESDDSELAEYHAVLRDTLVPILSSVVLGADRGVVSGDAAALPAHDGASFTPESALQEARHYMENASSPWWRQFGDSAIAILQRVLTHRATSAADLELLGRLALDRLQPRSAGIVDGDAGVITIDQLRLLDLLFLRVTHVNVVPDDHKAWLVFACISSIVSGVVPKEEESFICSVLGDCLDGEDESANMLAAVARNLDPGFKQCGRFVRKLLKTRYRSHESMRCVSLLSEHVLALDRYEAFDDITATDFPSASALSDLITGHSAFSRVCAPEQTADAVPSRTELLTLLAMAVEHAQEDLDDDESLLPLEVIPMFYTGYTASESEADRALFRIFTACERSGTSPLVAWHKSAQDPLCSPDIPEGAMLAGLMDMPHYVEMVTATLASASTSVVQEPAGDTSASTDFLLPYCDAVVQSEVNSRKCIDLGVAGFIIAAMTASKLEHRQLAYHAMARFLDKVVADSAFSERFQIMLVLHSVRGAIEQAYQRLPAVITTFVSASLHVLVRPEHALYEQLNRFLLQRAQLDLTDIPMFYSLFNSASAKDFKYERGWILKILLDSVAPTGLDLPIFRRRHVFELLMGFFDVGFSDAYTCRLVLQIIERCIAIPSFLVMLVESHGLVAWLSRLISADRFGGEAKVNSRGSSSSSSKDAGKSGKEDVQADYGVEILSSVLRVLSAVLKQYSSLERQAAFATIVLPQFAPAVIIDCVSMLSSDKVLWSATASSSMPANVIAPALELILELLQQPTASTDWTLHAADLLPLLSKLEEASVESRCRTLMFAVVCHWPIRAPDSTDVDGVSALVEYACHSNRCAELAAAQETGTAWPAVYSCGRAASKSTAARKLIGDEERSAEWVASLLVVRWLRATAMRSPPGFAGKLLLPAQPPTEQAADVSTSEVLRHCGVVLATGTSLA
eukprot:COSAG06_NODE_445_length_15690_cov_28.448849_4_plen_2106_part_00